jgi:AcrR family transcriptional regulator
MKSRRDENADASRAALLAAARELFGTEGFAAVSLEAVARRARMTTGAVYHHFANKKALFQATAEALEAELMETGRQQHPEPDLWLRMRSVFPRLVERCADPIIQRILFVEAPQVIGPETWREIELRYTYGAMRQNLATLIEQGRIRPYPLDLVTRLLIALAGEASAALAADGSESSRAQVSDLMDRIFAALEA